MTPCQPEADGCRWLELTISKTQPLGTIKGNLWIELPDRHQRTQIALRGMLVDNDFKAKTLDPAALSSKTSDQPDSVKTTNAQRATTDLSKSIKNAVQQANEIAPPGKGPLLKWTVANGRLIYGFQIFRAESEEGPFVLHSSTTIRANAQDDAPVSYQWRDVSAESSKTYWYYIGIVNKDGAKQQLGRPAESRGQIACCSYAGISGHTTLLAWHLPRSSNRFGGFCAARQRRYRYHLPGYC